MATVADSEASAPRGYTAQPPSTTLAFPPEPDAPLDYPIKFLGGTGGAADEDVEGGRAGNDGTSSSGDVKEVSIFSALSWLLPIFALAQYVNAKEVRQTLDAARAAAAEREKEDPSNPEVVLRKEYPDVANTLMLLPIFAKFFEVEKKMIPQHSEYYYYVTTFTFPTPKGERSVTRSKVEGDSKAHFAKPVHASAGANYGNSGRETGAAQLAAHTVTNSTAVFSLLPGHNHFLVHYERDKLNVGMGRPDGARGSAAETVTVQKGRSAFSLFTYVDLDMLRFAFVAMKELLDDSKTFNLNDGSISLLARRDIKKNNLSSAFCLDPKATGEAEGGGGGGSAGGGGGSAGKDEGRPKKATNVITAPRKELVEERREIAQKRFLKSDLEEECQRRWPHTPISKSLIFVFEEKAEGDLTPEEIRAMGLDERRIAMNKAKNRRGQKFYLGIAELPFFNKKGGTARFKADRLWNAKKDAESAAAEAALTALRNAR